MSTSKITILKSIEEEFDKKYGSFKLCEIVNKKDYDRLKDFLHTQISQLLEEQAKELLIRRKEEKIETAKATDWAVRKQLLGEIETLIAEEMIIANKEGQKTSRLTSLAMRLKTKINLP